MTNARRWAIFGPLALIVLALVLIEGRSLVMFRTAWPWSAPDRIHYCGRDYDKAGVVSAVTARNDGEVAPFKQMTRGPLWQPIYGHPVGAAYKSISGEPCAMELFVRDGSGYQSYELSGGP